MKNKTAPIFTFLKGSSPLFISQQVIFADLVSHQLYLTQWYSVGFCLKFSCFFSSSKAPWSNLINSLGTPCGLHYVCEKIGYHTPLNGEMICRKFTGVIVPQAHKKEEKAKILGRILRLKGCQWGINLGFDSQNRCCDTYTRCVYLHGTNLERFIPEPLSCGCLLLKSKDLLHLFELTHIGAFCFISQGSFNF